MLLAKESDLFAGAMTVREKEKYSNGSFSFTVRDWEAHQFPELPKLIWKTRFQKLASLVTELDKLPASMLHFLWH